MAPPLTRFFVTGRGPAEWRAAKLPYAVYDVSKRHDRARGFNVPGFYVCGCADLKTADALAKLLNTHQETVP